MCIGCHTAGTWADPFSTLKVSDEIYRTSFAHAKCRRVISQANATGPSSIGTGSSRSFPADYRVSELWKQAAQENATHRDTGRDVLEEIGALLLLQLLLQQ